MNSLPSKRNVLFVCLGNSCRSPIAEGVMMKLVQKSGQEENWEIDSAALAPWHVGDPPNHRALETMKKHNISYSSSNRSRQIDESDFHNFDFIFGMDEENVKELKRRAPINSKAQVLLLGDFDPEGDRNIRDPYRDWLAFEKCYVQAMRSCTAFLEEQNLK